MATGLDAFIDKSKTAMTMAGVSAEDALEADASLQDVVKALDEFLTPGGGRVLEQENDCFPVAPRWSVEGVTGKLEFGTRSLTAGRRAPKTFAF
jgi:hypothetical protein